MKNKFLQHTAEQKSTTEDLISSQESDDQYRQH